MFSFLIVGSVLLKLVSSSQIIVTPPDNQFLPENSPVNVTFRCNVTGSSGQNRSAVWAVQGRQIDNAEDNNPTRSSFAENGIFIDVAEAGVTDVIITELGRRTFSPTVTVQCSSFSDIGGLPITEDGEELVLTTFGPPGVPTGLGVGPSTGDPNELVFSWTAPEGLLAEVDVNYTVVISGPTFNPDQDVSETFFMFGNDVASDCEPHNFSVFASNAAGRGPAATVTDTIPISPNIVDINEGFQITDVSLTSVISVALLVPRALACNPAFPILNHSLAIPSLQLILPLNFAQGEDLFTGNVANSDILPNEVYEVLVEACIEIACQQSQLRALRTTDVQQAGIIFFENNIFLNCSFASNSNANGCVFQLRLVNRTDDFFLPRTESMVSQCNQTMNAAEAYVQLIAVDKEADGTLSMLAPIVLQPVVIEDAGAYTSLTGCVIPEPESALSGGAVAGIVIAVLLVVVAVFGVVVVVVVYRIRTGHWFKLREKDDEKLTVDFEKSLLMGDEKPKKRKGSMGLHSSRHGHVSPDIGEEGAAIALADAAIEPAVVPLKVAGEVRSAMNPSSAFTLDISSDKSKVKLHLNRALIKRVLHDNKLSTVERKRARRQISSSKHHLLPLQCEVRVQVEEEEN